EAGDVVELAQEGGKKSCLVPAPDADMAVEVAVRALLRAERPVDIDAEPGLIVGVHNPHLATVGSRRAMPWPGVATSAPPPAMHPPGLARARRDTPRRSRPSSSLHATHGRRADWRGIAPAPRASRDWPPPLPARPG